MSDLSSGETRVYLDVEVRRVFCRCYSKVKRERLAFVADNPHHTKRFIFCFGRRCGDVPVANPVKWSKTTHTGSRRP